MTTEQPSEGDDIRNDDYFTAMELINRRAEEKRPVTGVATGFFDLDDLTGGLQPGQLIILASRPSVGKTSLALNMCEHIAVNRGIPTLLISLESSRIEVAQRLLCARSRVDGHKMRTGQGMHYAELNAFGKIYDDLRAAPLSIEDDPDIDVDAIEIHARRLRRERDLGLVVIDNIHLLGRDRPGEISQHEDISAIARRLLKMAHRLDTPILVLAQLKGGPTARDDLRPRLSDLRDSGVIEDVADVVVLLHRPDYYDPNDQPGIAEVIVAKNRHGATGWFRLVFLKYIARFEHIAPILTARPPL